MNFIILQVDLTQLQGRKAFSDIVFLTRIVLASHVLSAFDFGERTYTHELAARVRTSADLQTDIWRES